MVDRPDAEVLIIEAPACLRCWKPGGSVWRSCPVRCRRCGFVFGTRAENIDISEAVVRPVVRHRYLFGAF